MGYEMKFYVVRKTNQRWDENRPYKFAEVIAMFNYCKDYDLADWIDKNYQPTDCYIYADDGNTKILEDMYGSPLIEIPIKDMVEYLEKNNDDYRRATPLLSLLKVFNEDNETKWDNKLAILRYGY